MSSFNRDLLRWPSAQGRAQPILAGALSCACCHLVVPLVNLASPRMTGATGPLSTRSQPQQAAAREQALVRKPSSGLWSIVLAPHWPKEVTRASPMPGWKDTTQGSALIPRLEGKGCPLQLWREIWALHLPELVLGSSPPNPKECICSSHFPSLLSRLGSGHFWIRRTVVWARAHL